MAISAPPEYIPPGGSPALLRAEDGDYRTWIWVAIYVFAALTTLEMLGYVWTVWASGRFPLRRTQWKSTIVTALRPIIIFVLFSVLLAVTGLGLRRGLGTATAAEQPDLRQRWQMWALSALFVLTLGSSRVIHLYRLRIITDNVNVSYLPSVTIRWAPYAAMAWTAVALAIALVIHSPSFGEPWAFMYSWRYYVWVAAHTLGAIIGDCPALVVDWVLSAMVREAVALGKPDWYAASRPLVLAQAFPPIAIVAAVALLYLPLIRNVPYRLAWTTAVWIVLTGLALAVKLAMFFSNFFMSLASGFGTGLYGPDGITSALSKPALSNPGKSGVDVPGCIVKPSGPGVDQGDANSTSSRAGIMKVTTWSTTVGGELEFSPEGPQFTMPPSESLHAMARWEAGEFVDNASSDDVHRGASTAMAS